MVYGSLRFDDALHVSPASVQLQDSGAVMVAWQTKVERQRRGTNYIVGRVSLSNEDWLSAGYKLWKKTMPTEYFDGDFFLCRHNFVTYDHHTPISYTMFVQNLGIVASRAMIHFQGSPEEREKTAAIIPKITAHSLRATMVSEMAHSGVAALPLRLQGHWKNDEMPAKYVRNREELSSKHVMEITEHLKKSWADTDGRYVDDLELYATGEDDEKDSDRGIVDDARLVPLNLSTSPPTPSCTRPLLTFSLAKVGIRRSGVRRLKAEPSKLR